MLAQLVEASTDAIFSQDLDGAVLTWNPGATRLYGWDATDMVGSNAEVLVPVAEADALAAAHATARGGQRVARFDTRHVHREGSLLPVAVTMVPILNPAGQVVAVCTSAADISERIRLADELGRIREVLELRNAALGRSNRDLEQFAYVASHDLSEPLRVIVGFVDQLERRYGDLFDERGRRYLNHILEAGTRMRALIDDLLEYSRYLDGPRHVKPVDLNTVADKALASWLNGWPTRTLSSRSWSCPR